MCDKAVDNHSSTVEYVPDLFKTQEIGNKEVHRYFFVSDSLPDQSIAQ